MKQAQARVRTDIFAQAQNTSTRSFKDIDRSAVRSFDPKRFGVNVDETADPSCVFQRPLEPAGATCVVLPSINHVLVSVWTLFVFVLSLKNINYGALVPLISTRWSFRHMFTRLFFGNLAL